tara:strand:+ start:3956 stop:4225 length:270 start_codon:yes stop_codon:yes gene_type:complete
MKRKTYERNRRLSPGFTQKPLKKMRKNMSIDITKSKFDEYKTVQVSGMFNMFDPRARQMTSLSKDEWVTIMQDYDKLNKAWGDNEADEK